MSQGMIRNCLTALLLLIPFPECGAAGGSNNESVKNLLHQIAALGRDVGPEEARRVAECAYATASDLRENYGVVGPPLFHNFLVNTGIRKRGLCFQWAEDLLARLDTLKLTTLELHWGEARARTWREHNCVVVTARGRPFKSGIILDCWRHSGRLYWAPLASDHYPWIEDSDYARVARAKLVQPRIREKPKIAVTASEPITVSQL